MYQEYYRLELYFIYFSLRLEESAALAIRNGRAEATGGVTNTVMCLANPAVTNVIEAAWVSVKRE